MILPPIHVAGLVLATISTTHCMLLHSRRAVVARMASIMVEKHEIDGTSSQPASRSTLLFRRFVQSLVLVLYLHGAASLGSYAVAKVGDRFWPLQASVGRETSPGSPFDWAKASSHFISM